MSHKSSFLLSLTFMIQFSSVGLSQSQKEQLPSTKQATQHTWKGQSVTYKQFRDSLKKVYSEFCDSLRSSKWEIRTIENNCSKLSIHIGSAQYFSLGNSKVKAYPSWLSISGVNSSDELTLYIQWGPSEESKDKIVFPIKTDGIWKLNDFKLAIDLYNRLSNYRGEGIFIKVNDGNWIRVSMESFSGSASKGFPPPTIGVGVVVDEN